MQKYAVSQFIFILLIVFMASYVYAQEQMEVEGAITIGAVSSATPADGTIQYDGTEFLGWSGGMWNSLTGTGGISPWIISGNNVYFGDVNGAVGVGTSTPDAKLHIVHNATNSAQLKLEESEDNKFTKLFLNNSSNATDKWAMSANLGTTADHEIGWFYNSSSRLVYDETNKGLGINTANPLATLHVFDNSKDTLDMLIAPYSNGGKHSKIIMAEDNDATFHMSWLYEGDLNVMQLHGQDGVNAYGPHMQVKRNSGAVAFGDTFANGYRVTVDGKMICEELQVLLKADWPDYVFEDQYKLMPIEELSYYINEHHHLPGIPAASKIAEEGIAIGEMQKMMMEKIEELTLYVIDLQKEVELLKVENKALRN